jgi:putative transposase
VTKLRSCSLILLRSVFYYQGRPRDYTLLRNRLRDLAGTRVRYGYRRLMVLLRREGINHGHNLVYRIYRDENLGVKRRKRRKRAANLRTMPEPAISANERWSMDFVTDRLETDRAFRVLTLIDQYTRECPILEPGISLTGRHVVEALERVRAVRPLPQSITVDNGGELPGERWTPGPICTT